MSALDRVALVVLAVAITLVVYAYLGYPLALWVMARGRNWRTPEEKLANWPFISILVAVYNEEHQIRDTIESLLAIDYPADRRQILFVSDASTDRTDEIVREFGHRGVELLRLSTRGGKTLAENAAAEYLRGEIVVNTDASIRIRADSLKPMIAAFADPGVGVVSGQDVSVATTAATATGGEASYVGYEMWVRELETRVGGIVGASGCFFAIRSELQRKSAPAHLSRDFSAALVARKHGLIALSLPMAVCFVPRSTDIRAEYNRKVRTFTRGMETLLYNKSLLNPGRYGDFAWKLASHKLARWLIPWALLAGYISLGILAIQFPSARFVFAVGTAVLAVAATLWIMARRRVRLPAWAALVAFALMSNIAVMRASLLALRGERAPIWEPTRRVQSFG